MKGCSSLPVIRYWFENTMWFSIVLQVFFITALFGQTTGYSDAFINIGTSPKSIALGQSVSALPQNISGLTINPSATAAINNYTLNGMYINQFEMAEYFSLGVLVPLNNEYHLGIHGINLLIDNIFERPDLNNISNLEVRRDSIRKLIAKGYNSFGTRETAIFFNISKSNIFNINMDDDPIIIGIPVGLNIKLIQKDMYKSNSKGIGLDIGGMVEINLEKLTRFNWLEELVLGLSINNFINTAIYWDSGDKDYIPMQIVAGAAYLHSIKKLPLKYTLLMQKNFLYRDETQYGIEFTILDIIDLRGGYNYGYMQGGLGLNFKYRKYKFGIDYSFSDHDLGNVHRIGGWVSF